MNPFQAYKIAMIELVVAATLAVVAVVEGSPWMSACVGVTLGALFFIALGLLGQFGPSAVRARLNSWLYFLR